MGMKLEDVLFAGSSYVGIELDNRSRNLLLQLKPIPEGWRILAHHISIVPPPAVGGFKRLLDGKPLDPKKDKQWQGKEELKGTILQLLGSPVRLTVTDFGMSDKAMAFKVEVEGMEGLPSLNKFRHVTVAVSPDGSPKDSNDIIQFEPVENHLELSGEMRIIG